jgi:outer membrane protein OmpA-like peptidoglycan-associated protein
MNASLSECRAKSLLDCLVNVFLLSGDNLAVKGYGASQLLYSDDMIKTSACKDCDDGHQKNRRVELKILSVP